MSDLSLRDRPMGHVPALDGIRGLAVLAVVVHHLDHLTGGYLGVDAFFVLSGFLITGLLVDEMRFSGRQRNDLGRFWMRRVKRLFPALAVLLVVVMAVEAFVVEGTPSLRREVLSSIFYAYNWTALVDGVDYWSNFAAPSPLRHMWSLAIEEQFYVVWPLVVGLVFAVVARRTDRRGAWRLTGMRAVGGVAAALAVISVIGGQIIHDPDNLLRVYYGTDARVAAILFGATAAVLARSIGPMSISAQRVLWIAATLACVPILWAWVALEGTSSVLYRGGLTVTGLAVTLVVLSTVLAPRSPLVRVLELAPLRWCGLVSYGLYLWHWPIIVWLTPARTGLDGVGLITLQVALTLAATLLSYFLVEQPIRRSTFAPRPTALVGALAVAALVAVTFVVASRVAAPLEQPEAGTRSTVPIPPPPSSPPPPQPQPSTPASPAPPSETETTDTTNGTATSDGDTSDVAGEAAAPDGAGALSSPLRRLMVFGDSGAWFLGEELLAEAPADVIVVPRGVVGCGIASAGGGVYTADGSFLADPEGCDDWADTWAADVEAFQPDHVLIVLSWPGIGDRQIDDQRAHPCDPTFDDYYAGQLVEAIEAAGSTGAEVVVATAPYYVTADGGAVEPERVDCLNEVMRATSAEHGATIVDLAAWTCPDGDTCRVSESGATLRPDGLHFAGDGGRIAARWILEQLGDHPTLHDGAGNGSGTRGGRLVTAPTAVGGNPTESGAPALASGYLPLLDGLRAIAVALVVAYHLDAPWATGGFLGVDLFFVISGFLITTLLLRERDSSGSIGIRSFWSRRFRRLVPALAVMIAATIALTRQYGIPEQWSSVRGDAFAALAYVANWHFIFAERSYFETLLGPSPLEHTWSLAVEEQWYLLWPVVVAAMVAVLAHRKWRATWVSWLPVALIVAATVASAALMAVLYDPRDPTRVYFGTDTRAQQLLVGAALAWILRLRPRWATVDGRRGVSVASVALVALVAIACTTSDRAEWLYRGGFLAVSLIAAVVVWGVAGAARTSALGWLAWRPLAWAGTRSYGIYLWHWPIIVFVGPPMGIELGRLPLAIVQVALTLVVAELSYRLVEQPVRRTSWRPSWVIGGWATACVAILVAVAVILSPPADRAVEATVLTPTMRPATTDGTPTATSDAEPGPTAPTASASPESTDGSETSRPSSSEPRTTIARGTEGPNPGSSTSAPSRVPTSTATTSTAGSPPTAAAANDEPPSMFVVGDSTAFKLLNSIAGNEPPGWHIDAYATIGCGISAGLPIDAGADHPVPYDERCTTWREDWAFWRHELQPDVTVVMLGAWEVLDHEIDGRVVEFPSAEWHDVVRAGISEGLDIAGGDGRPVVALSLPCMRQSDDSAIPATARNDPARVDAFNRLLTEEAASRPNADVVDLAGVLCPGGEYLEEIDGSPTRYDGVHVTPEGAAFVMDWLVSELSEVLATGASESAAG